MAVFAGLTFFACNDDDEKEERKLSYTENLLKGSSWAEFYDETLDDRILDTIWFKKDGTVQDKTGIFSNNRYNIVNDSVISFINDSCTYKFRFSIIQNDNNYEITFYNFINNSLTEVVKNITYKKINQP